MTEQLWTIQDVADWLQVGKTKAYEVAADPKAPKSIRLGRERRWLSEDWYKWAYEMRSRAYE